MSELNSGTVSTARVSATVKLYDAEKGYGFLAPGGGLPDIFCHASALRKVGLYTLVQGAIVICDTVPGDRGPQVARIHSVDFSTAAATRDDGRTRGEPGSARAGPPASGDRVRAVVKWYVPVKGYGFLEPGDGGPDIFCHAAVVAASGRHTLPGGAAVTCEIVQGERGPQVSRILDVEVEAEPHRDAGSSRPRRPLPDPAWVDGEAAGLAVQVQGTVKFYDPGRGFGFVIPDGGGPEVFVHGSALSRSGLDGLQQGERVRVWIEEAPRGPQATEVEPI